MAKGQELQAQLDGKRKELAEVTKAATDATQASIAAKNELGSVLDETAAVALVARERVQGNRARALNGQAADLEREISELEQLIKEQAATEADAEVRRQMPVAVAALWQAFERAQALVEAERVALAAKSAAEGGNPWQVAQYWHIVDQLGDVLQALGVARWDLNGRTGTKILRRV